MTNDRSAISAVASGCAVAGPVVDKSWFGSRRAGACFVRTEVPLSAEMMVAALYCAGYFITAEDVIDDGELWGFIAQVVAQEGTGFLEDAVENLPVLERTGRLPPPRGGSGAEWLAFCRRRIAALMGQTARPADA